METIEGRIAVDDGLIAVRIVLAEGLIAAVEPRRGAGGPLIVPGFVDCHCHGAGGADVMEAGEAVRTVAATHARFGTTGFLATTMTAPVEEIEAALDAVARAMADPDSLAAEILGVHLEGPFISGDRLGAQPNFPRPADLALMGRFLDRVPIRVVTLAPEADPDRAMTAFLQARGTRVQLGHSSCTYETARPWLDGGGAGVTHLFNAMTPLQHRAAGLAGCALAHARHAELIADLVHVDAGAIRAALRAIPDLYAITDATAASGMPDGPYRLGRQPVESRGGAVRLADGTLAGSCLTMHRAFKTLVALGLPLAEVVRRTATIAADYLGLSDRGRIAPGLRADLVLMDEALAIVDVRLRGRSLL